jgi:hypothetical protein
MQGKEHLFKDLSVPTLHRDKLLDIFDRFRIGDHVNILVVADTEVSIDEGIPFGINRVIQIIRGTTVGCMSFSVDIAVRSGGSPTIVANPGANGAKYTGFRFDMKDSDGTTPVIHRYQQIWCFGFKPDNFGGPDSNITLPGSFPASDSELAVLSKWMDDRKGGVFATGDHDYLGASMCHRIPRVRTMRRWTNADSVPPIGTPDRIDTLRPGTEPLGNFTDQEDETPQPIQWIPWASIRLSPFRVINYPHPVLCHPQLGPINVMPDHAHEGLCFDNNEVNLGGSYNFDGTGNKPEYPQTPSGQPTRPLVIAYGSTLGDATFEKGPQPYRPKFPMISVYDGHLANVGRVAVDSTWHHWMNINIVQMEAAGGNNWEKIKRYFVNLAVWLCPPGYTTNCFIYWVLVSHLGYFGYQEYSPKLSDFELGRVVRNPLTKLFGPCGVIQFILDIVFELNPKLRLELFKNYVVPIDWKEPRPPIPDPCLTCPPLDLIQEAVLGGIIRATERPATELRQAVESNKAPREITFESIRKAAGEGVRTGLGGLAKYWQASLNHSEELLKLLR